MTKKILLIEDIPVTQKLYADFLKERGYGIDTASDGKVALAMVGQNVYDFILVDLLLPEVNGISFLEQFKNRPKQTTILVLSDFFEPKVHERAKELGVKYYLIKSENPPSQLADKLDKYAQKVDTST